jgi:hypothetical protein
MFEGLTKNCGKKQKKTKYFPECQGLGTRGRGSSPSARDKALGEEVPTPSVACRHSRKRSPSPSARPRHSGKSFFFNFFVNGSV